MPSAEGNARVFNCIMAKSCVCFKLNDAHAVVRHKQRSQRVQFTLNGDWADTLT